MLCQRSQHKSVALMGKIYTVAGYANRTCTNQCETYNIKFNVWKEFTPLNKQRANCAICTYMRRYLYVVGGHEAENSIEKIDLFANTKCKWECITFEWKYDLKCSMVMQVGNEIIMFGNYYDSHEECILLDPIEGKVRKGTNIPVTPCMPYFYMRSPIITESSSVAAIDYGNTVFKWNEDSTWEVISISNEGMIEVTAN